MRTRQAEDEVSPSRRGRQHGSGNQTTQEARTKRRAGNVCPCWCQRGRRRRTMGSRNGSGMTRWVSKEHSDPEGWVRAGGRARRFCVKGGRRGRARSLLKNRMCGWPGAFPFSWQ